MCINDNIYTLNDLNLKELLFMFEQRALMLYTRNEQMIISAIFQLI